ncbi:MAG: phage portal protein [Amphritea sp.]|nr:phage portal protein [Amphritea sp.]
MNTPTVEILAPNGQPARQQMSYNGAGAGFGGQLRDWAPGLKTADAALLPNLDLGNARADDVVRNNAFASNGVQLHIDNIVGSLFRLSFKPRWQQLGIKEADAMAFARDVEAAWLEIAEDPVGCYLDAERKRTFTMLIREGVGTHVRSGEDMFSAEWIPGRGSLIATAIKQVTPKRVCNPNRAADSATRRGGVELDRYGAAVAYHLRSQNNTAFGFGDGMGHTWRRITRETRFGRPKFCHVFEPTEDGQTRGANQFLAVLEQMQMLPKMQQTKLQNAIVNSMYAATLEAELGPEAASALIGGDLAEDKLTEYMGAVEGYHNNVSIKMNGARIPHLLPGERLNLQTSGNVDNGYVDLESSVLRWLAAGLNVAYEPFAKDFKQLSWSAAQASLGENWRHFMGKRKIIAERKATIIFRLVLEEMLFRNLVKLPRGASRDFYQATAAWTNCTWIGAGRFAIDGLKAVREAILKIEYGLSTYEKELAIMGEDYQETFMQQVREQEERKEKGLPRPAWMQFDKFAQDEQQASEA